MASTSKINSAVATQNAFCPEGGVCKHGFLIKSPPLQLLSSQNSWKRRFFTLFKSSKGNYFLKYLKGQNIKGSIAVDEIINIEVGISRSEIMEMVRKMFKCLPEQVMSISTGKRCYYLIGSSREETEDWVTVISSVSREAKRGGCCPQNQELPCPAIRSRPSSLPLPWNPVDPMSFPERQCYQKENGSSEDRNRPNSDPGPHQDHCDSPRRFFPSLGKNLGKSEENLLLSDTDEDITKEEEDYYQTPSNILAKYPREVSKPVSTAGSDVHLVEEPVQDNPIKEDIYMPMKSLQVTDESQLQKLDIFIPQADINSYLKLTEAAGHICVSQWTGPHRLGCLFNHGDHIVAVNDLQPQDIEEAYLFISRSTRKEVKLTVCRIPHSDIFHVKGCSSS
ncbi:pleckstrin homology domain-containing family S member 1 isoform X4 [Apus apus]|uniref:pleckstrin homology domain-containing family S member 1 isoform X4 n=1 Tax=Apus apus TaxID=8895 RepID=UPI0021F83A2C|nr:pleckstrin homology domain-containing family S member 1 isoform X4 [Apus apus]